MKIHLHNTRLNLQHHKNLHVNNKITPNIKNNYLQLVNIQEMNPKCIQCEKTESVLWRKNSESAEICNDCFETNLVKTEDSKEKETQSVSDKTEKEESPKDIEISSAPTESSKTRKSTRSTRFKSKAITRQKSTKSVSRRSCIFKSAKPFKTPNNICAETRTKTHLFYNGFYYQVGDIVSVVSKGNELENVLKL